MAEHIGPQGIVFTTSDEEELQDDERVAHTDCTECTLSYPIEDMFMLDDCHMCEYCFMTEKEVRNNA